MRWLTLLLTGAFCAAAGTALCQTLPWKPLTSAPAALVTVYRTAGGVSDPNPTLQDVRAARFLRVQEPGQSVPLFLIDPQQEGLSGSGGSLLVGCIPVGHSYRQVLAENSRWSSVGRAANVRNARKQAARGNVSVLRQKRHGLPMLFLPEAGLRLPMHADYFNGKEYASK